MVRNGVPPPVSILSIGNEKGRQPMSSTVGFAAGTHTVEIGYTALSLSIPQRVEFRYKLEGVDKEWQDVGNRRQAYYTSLGPGQYTFRVIASNNDGVWNDAGATLGFSVAPAWYQTNWFRIVCVVSVVFVVWVIYRLRVLQIARGIGARFDERLAERTRIARELHDTLLQSFHGLIFRFQAADNLLPTRPAEAKLTLESALDDAAQAITEARDAVHELRSSAAVTSDLPAAITALGEELAAHHTAAAASQDLETFIVEVEGTPQDLHPILRDEIYRIAGEGLRNAFSHAQARRVEVEIRYGDRQFQVRIRDNGIGIDPSVLTHEGRTGHWGLTGMRERAKRIGGEMDVWSELGAGTEVELRITASIAYKTYAGRRFRLFRKKAGRSS
jgi:signal transduction histidine kinase